METNVSRVEPQSGKFPQAVIWIAGIALTLFCAVGIAAVMGWIPSSLSGPSGRESVAQPPASAPVAAVATCAECGVIESVRVADAQAKVSTTNYRITVRLNDGSSRVISEAGLPRWRSGDKVKIVSGAIQPHV